uniref:Putative secreted protein n=1 Tax=Anopheles triannulatus TaxID=58253 RepID=A0A2M4B1X3_9DIPT
MMIVIIAAPLTLLHSVLAHLSQHMETHILHASMQRTCQSPPCYSCQTSGRRSGSSFGSSSLLTIARQPSTRGYPDWFPKDTNHTILINICCQCYVLFTSDELDCNCCCCCCWDCCSSCWL